MSGRLIILPHKSWNVWNRDNREKVARDERLHKEEEAANEKERRQKFQEHQFEVLSRLQSDDRTNTVEVANADDDIALSDPHPFRLFGDIEQQIEKRAQNMDYEKEKAAKELADKRREGTAPWALGEGSIEVSKSKPWYLQRHDVSSTIAVPVCERDSVKKCRSDPMFGFMKNMPDFDGPSVEGHLSSRVVRNSEKHQSSVVLLANQVDSMKNGKRKHKEHTEKEKKKKRSSEKHKKHSKDRDREMECLNAHVVPVASAIPESDGIVCVSSTSIEQSELMALLRKKRLVRERQEGKKAALLLADMDIFGPSPAGNGVDTCTGLSGHSIKGGYNDRFMPTKAARGQYS